MKNVLVVSATPEPQSFISSMAQKSCEVMRDLGHKVTHSDLYAMQWNPVASAADFADRKDPDYLTYALEQRHGVSTKTIAKDVQEELEKLLSCDVLILNFPIYWFSVPAIMKGWFDRVIVSGACYGGMRFYDNGGLAGKKGLVGATLGGQPHMFAEDGIHGPLNEMLRPLLRGTLAYTGMSVLEPFFGFHVPYISEEARAKTMSDYINHLQNLEDLPALDFPSMSNFDDQLRPLAEQKN